MIGFWLLIRIPTISGRYPGYYERNPNEANNPEALLSKLSTDISIINQWGGQLDSRDLS